MVANHSDLEKYLVQIVTKVDKSLIDIFASISDSWNHAGH